MFLSKLRSPLRCSKHITSGYNTLLFVADRHYCQALHSEQWRKWQIAPCSQVLRFCSSAAENSFLQGHDTVLKVTETSWHMQATKYCHDSEVKDGFGMRLGWGRQKMHTEFWWKNLWKNVHLEEAYWEDNIQMDLKKLGCKDGRWMKLAYCQGQW